VSTLFFDFETTNKRKGTALDLDNRVVMVSYCVDDGPVKNYTGPIMDAQEFWSLLTEVDSACAYNAKFEQHWLLRLGFDIDGLRWHDPMLAEKVKLGNITKPMSMDAVAGRYGFDTKDPMIDAMMKGGICPSEMPQKRLRARCNRDVRVLRDLHRKLMGDLRANEQIHLYRNRCEFSTVLTHIEAAGMVLDKARVDEQYAKYAREVAQLEAGLDKLTGGINLNSPDQKAHFLYGTLGFPEKKGAHGKPLRNKPSKQFPKGRPKTDKDTMTWLMSQATTERQKQFVSQIKLYSKANAALSKNLDFFRGVCLEYGGRFHAVFNQTVAATHRLTSSGMPLVFECFEGKSKSVQFQNMPREFKRLFCKPAQGYVVVEVDAMQLEFRVAAYVGDDSQARKDIDDPDFDAHCRTASVMNQFAYHELLMKYRAGDKIIKKLRQDAKPDTFKPLYGGTKGTPEQERYYRSFAERYCELVRQQEDWLAEVCREGMFRTPWGMEFSFDTYINRHGTAMNKRTHKPVGPQVYNYPVQNLATAEIVPIAICALYRRVKELGLDVQFVNTIHDSVICYVAEADLNLFREEAEQAFTTDVYEHLSLVYGIEFDVPLGMEMVAGDYWNEGTETVFDDVTNGRFA
jgi:DNA polymerase I-like protein with 3'-5' exonuclease and polymerase domains